MKIPLGASLGNCVHVAGIYRFRLWLSNMVTKPILPGYPHRKTDRSNKREKQKG